ncbi:MAG TPA: TolC family protein [Kofleriaceae bacterium]|nr:TolC family protein [Kofleriaceae bacterium]
MALLGARPASGQAPAPAPEVHELALADAVRAAIQSDAELYIAREDAREAADGVALARSAFVPRLFGEASVTRNDQPPSATSFPVVDAILGATLGVAGRVQTGLTYQVTAGLQRQNHRDPFSTVYDPALATTVRAEITQPLWRGGFGAARRPIVVASLRRGRGDQELRARIESTIGAVEAAYWNLVRARSERDARSSALAVAREQADESRGLRRLGTGSDLDVVEAEAGVSRRQQELLQSEQELVEADGRLFEALGVRDGDPGWAVRSAIVPTDTPQIEPLARGVDAEIALARTRRADVLAAQRLIDAEAAQLAVTDDQRRPALDLVASAGTVGFAGTLASTYATAGVNGAGLDPPYQTDPAYDGGLGTSLKNTLGRDLDLFIGLRFEMLLGDGEAQVRHTIQHRALTRAQLAERQTLARIESEVRTTVARLAVNEKLVAAADRTVELSVKLLEGTRKRFRAGASTTFDVLRVSEELTRARIEAARARADYRASLTRLAAATGTLLDRYRITVQSLGPSPVAPRRTAPEPSQAR